MQRVICSFETREWEKPHLRPHLWFFPIGLNVKMLLSKTSLMLMNFDLANSRALTPQFPLNAPQTAHQLVNRCDMHWMWLLWKLLSIHNLILLEAWNQYSSHSFAVSNLKLCVKLKDMRSLHDHHHWMLHTLNMLLMCNHSTTNQTWPIIHEILHVKRKQTPLIISTPNRTEKCIWT